MSFSKPTVLCPRLASHNSEILRRALSPQNRFPNTRLASISTDPSTALLAKTNQLLSAQNISPHPSLYALIIATNTYPSPELIDLRGAEPDAHALKTYLMDNLKVPEDQITSLLNRDASRRSIIEAFQSLASSPRIKEGDAIVIYFAGHGTELSYEDGSTFQAIIPHDFCAGSIYVIPDHVLGRLIEEIAKEKGNNITVIFDCCNAGSGTRGLKDVGAIRNTDSLARSAILGQDAYNPDVDKDILYGGRRGSTFCTKFRHGGLNSHMFIGACGSSEPALESNGHGHFSSALFKLLRTISPDKLRYCDILTHMDPISGQNPQCEGVNRDRTIFNGKVLPCHRQFHRVIERKGKGNDRPQFILQAGSAQGITDGAKFAIYSPNNMENSPAPLIATVKSVGAFTALLKIPRNMIISPLSVAMQTRAGRREDLRLFVPLHDEFRDMYRSLCESEYRSSHNFGSTILVDSPDLAHLKVTWKDSWVTFSVVDEMATRYGFEHQFEVFANLNLVAAVLRKASHFYRELNRINCNHDINGLVEIELYKLQESGYDERGILMRIPIWPNLCPNQSIDIVVEEEAPYGIRIVNNSRHDFYVYVYYFDNSDLSIQSYLETPVSPYLHDPQLKGNGSAFTIGYGAGGVPPVTYWLQYDNQDIDVGFLKVILTTKAIDLSGIPQKSPFTNSRRPVAWSDPSEGFTLKGLPHTWHTMVVPVIQRRRHFAND